MSSIGAFGSDTHYLRTYFTSRLPANILSFSYVINTIGSLFVLLPICGIIVYYGCLFMYESYQWGSHADSISGLISQFMTTGIGEKSSDPGGLLNRFIIKGMIPLSFLFLGLSAVSFIIKNVRLLTENPSKQIK